MRRNKANTKTKLFILEDYLIAKNLVELVKYFLEKKCPYKGKRIILGIFIMSELIFLMPLDIKLREVIKQNSVVIRSAIYEKDFDVLVSFLEDWTHKIDLKLDFWRELNAFTK